MVKQSRAVDKGLAVMIIPACPVHVTSTVNKFDQGVPESRCQVPEHTHAISSLSFSFFFFLFFPNLEFTLLQRILLNLVFKVPCCDRALRMHLGSYDVF